VETQKQLGGNGEVKLGLFALRGGGKTVALTCLYKKGSGDGLDLDIVDEASILYLRPLAERLDQGYVPVATEGPPRVLDWQATLGDAKYSLEFADFPGELLDVIGRAGDPVGESVLDEIRREVRERFIQVDAILLLIDVSDPSTLRSRDAIVRLLDDLARRPTLRGTTRRPIALVFTKGDKVAAGPNVLQDSEAVHNLLQAHPIYDVIRRRLEQRGDQVITKEFLVSALGWSFFSVPDKHKQNRTVEPANLFAAVRWAIEQAQREVTETHQQVLGELEQGVSERSQEDGLFTNHWRLKRELESADRTFNLATGPCADRFTELCARVDKRWAFQRRGLMAVGSLALSFALLAGYWWLRERRLEAYDAFDRVALEFPGDSGVHNRLAHYEEHVLQRGWDWLLCTRDRRLQADARAEADREALARIRADEAFVTWSKQDQQFSESRLDAHRHAAAKAYLLECGEGMQSVRLAIVTKVLTQTQAAHEAECARYQALADQPASRPEEFAAKAQKLRDYAKLRDAVMAAEAEALAKRTLLDWDGLEYEKVLRLSRSTGAPESFEELESAANEYLRSNGHPCTMAGHVRGLIRSIADMRGGKDYVVAIKQVQIPSASDLHAEFWGCPGCSVKVAVGAQVYETSEVKPPKKDADGALTIDVNQQLGPYRVAWGGTEPVDLCIVTKGWALTRVVRGQLHHDKLVMSRFNGPVRLTCGNGTGIILVTECPDAKPLSLPAFGG
jgi:hypothetical protein